MKSLTQFSKDYKEQLPFSLPILRKLVDLKKEEYKKMGLILEMPNPKKTRIKVLKEKELLNMILKGF